MNKVQLKALVEALDAAMVTTRDIASEVGLSEDTLYAYRMGRRRPSPESARAILRALDKHHRQLGRAIERLGRAVEHGKG